MKLFHLVATSVICISSVAYSQVFDVPYKEDAPTRTLLLPVQNAKAVVLLFPGGPGVLNLQDDGSTKMYILLLDPKIYGVSME